MSYHYLESLDFLESFVFKTNGQAVTIATASGYVEMMQTFFLPQIQEDVEEYSFQQGETTCPQQHSQLCSPRKFV